MSNANIFGRFRCTGPDLADARPWANLLVKPPLPLIRWKNGKALTNSRKTEHQDIDALKVRPIEDSKSRECDMITAVALFETKTFNDTEPLKSVLHWREKDY